MVRLTPISGTLVLGFGKAYTLDVQTQQHQHLSADALTTGVPKTTNNA